MRRHLPPLTALKAFEAAARNGSFSGAASELLVSQAAISHQIKQIEEYLGVQLFVRTNRMPELTPAGKQLLPDVTQAFDQIDRATHMVSIRRGARRLLVRAVPFLAARWLIPRLKDYRKSYPNVELHFHHSYGLPDFRREEVDIAILWGTGDWKDVNVDRLLPAPYTIVCSPQLLQGKNPIRTLADLDNHELLHISDYTIWERWVQAAAAPIRNVRRGLISDDQNTVVQAVISGQGVGLVVKYLVEDYLASSILACPFDITLDLGYSYHLVYPPSAIETPAVRSFRNWILKETREFLKESAIR
jgi:LysR family transcriptional regulator, glycine cleavage system transcriptional activator